MIEGLLLIGHGSRLRFNKEVLEFHAERIKRMNIFDEVMIGFLNQEPLVEKVLESMRSSRIFVVPFLISNGVHTTISLRGMFENSEKEIIVCDPPGMDEDFTHVILKMVERKR